jgi:hypothetical protein
MLLIFGSLQMLLTIITNKHLMLSYADEIGMVPGTKTIKNLSISWY